MTAEEKLKMRIKECFPDLLNFNIIWNDIKDFFIQEGKKQSEEDLK